MTLSAEKNKSVLQFVVSILLALLVFLWSLDLMTSSFQAFGTETALKVLAFTSNPFISLFIGLFVTAVIQSSSTSTSLIVAIVASGSMSLENAIPMIMGANVGTTLTSTIVSLSFITDNKAFKNAISTGVMHDFFNIFTVVILFPLEYYYQVLSGLSRHFVSMIGYSSPHLVSQTESKYFIQSANDHLIAWVNHDIILIIISCICLFISIKILSRLISKKMIGATEDRFQEVFFKNTFKSFGLGTLLTAGIQSSSISTSIIVPIGASGNIPRHKIFPYIIGANIGTTITALLASFNKSEAAISIAIAHILFNFIGMFIFLFIPIIKNIPIIYARKFGEMTMRYRVIGFFYILFTFFILPLALIFFNRIS